MRAPPLALFFTSCPPPSLLASNMPKELSQWTPGGVDLEGLDTLEAGLRGDVLCQSRWSLRHLCALQALGVALSPSGCIPVGSGLWRKR